MFGCNIPSVVLLRLADCCLGQAGTVHHERQDRSVVHYASNDPLRSMVCRLCHL